MKHRIIMGVAAALLAALLLASGVVAQGGDGAPPVPQLTDHTSSVWRSPSPWWWGSVVGQQGSDGPSRLPVIDEPSEVMSSRGSRRLDPLFAPEEQDDEPLLSSAEDALELYRSQLLEAGEEPQQIPSPDLWLNKRGVGNAVSGRTYDWEIWYANWGDQPAEDVVLVDDMSPGMTYVSDSLGIGVAEGNQVTFDLGTLDPMTAGKIILTVQIDAPPDSDMRNCAHISTSSWEWDTGNNDDCSGRHVHPDEVDVWVDKCADPWHPVPGHEYMIGINYGNNRGASALDVVIRDTLPDSVTFVSEWHPPGWSVDTSTPGVVVWTMEEMPGDHGWSVEMIVRVDEDLPHNTQLRNHVEITTSSNDVDPGNNSEEEDNWTRDPWMDMGVSKWDDFWGSQNSPVAGYEYTYRVEVRNRGNVVAHDVVLMDTLPAGSTFVRAALQSWNPDTGDNDLRTDLPPDDQGPGWVRWDLGELEPWRRLWLYVTIRIDDSVPAGTEMVNQVEVSSAEEEGDPGDNASEYRFTTQDTGPNLVVDKWIRDGQPCAGCGMSYDLALKNDGTETAYDVVLTDILPAEVEYQGCNWDTEVDGNTLTWRPGPMNPGDRHCIRCYTHIPDGVPAGTELVNWLEVATSSAESRTDDNVAENRVLVGPDLRVEKRLCDDELIPGIEYRYCIDIWNEGEAWAHNITLTDFLPPGTEYRGDDWGGEVQNGQVVWRMGDMGPGWHWGFSMGVFLPREVAPGTEVLNVLEIKNDAGDADPDDNRFELLSTVVDPYRVEVNQSHDSVRGRALPDTEVAVTLKNRFGVVKGAQNTWSDNRGNFYAGMHMCDHMGCRGIDPTDTVEVDTEGTPTIVIDVVRMQGVVDAAAETISGRVHDVPYPADLRGEVWFHNGPSMDGQTDGSGDYTLDFSPFDLRSGHEVALWYIRPDGHQVGIVRSHFWLEARLTDYVGGQTTPGARVELTLSAPDSGLQAVKGTAARWTNEDGSFGMDFRDEDDNRVEIAPGDVISGLADGKEATLEIPTPFSALYDHEANSVCGEAPPGTELDVCLWDYNCHWVTAEPDATYCVDFSPWGDPQIWDRGGVHYYDEENHKAYINLQTPAPDLWLEKWGEDAPVSGRTYDWTLRYLNEGAAPADNVVMTDTLPAGMTFVSDSTGTAAVVGNQVVWDLGTVAPGDWFTVTLTVQVDVEPWNDVENCAEIWSPLWEDDTGDNRSCSGQHVVADEVDLQVNKHAHPGDPAPGQEYRYRIDYCNNRPARALDVEIRDLLPDEVTFVSEWHWPGQEWTVDSSTPGEVRWTRPWVGGHECGNIEMVLRLNDDAPRDEPILNHVQISTASNDVEPGNDQHDQDVWARDPYVNLHVDKGYRSGSPVAGEEYTYWVDVSGGGNSVASSVVLTEDLDVGMTFVRAERIDWDPDTGGHDLRSPLEPEAQGEGFVRFALGDIPPWQWVQVEITVRINDDVAVGSNLANRVQVSSDLPDHDPGDNRAGYVFETQAPGPNLRVEKHRRNGEPCVDCGFEYGIRVFNDGTEPAFNVVVSDALPEAVQYEWNRHWNEPMVLNGTLLWDLGMMQPGSGRGEDIGVHVAGDTPAGTELLNVAEISSPWPETRYDDNVFEHRLVVGPNLRVEKRVCEGHEVLPGLEFRYCIDVWNDGDANANNVVLTDFLPAGVEYRWDDWGGEVQDGQVVWDLGNQSPGWGDGFQMAVYLPRELEPGTELLNVLEIGSDEDDADPGDNRVELISTVESPFRIQVQESHNWVCGRVLPGAHVDATLRDSGGVEKGTPISVDANDWGDFCSDFQEDIGPGDTVTLDSEGTAQIVIDVIPMDGTVDPAVNTISGHVYDVAYPADVRGEVWFEDGPSVEDQTDGAGDYAVDFSPFDVKSGHTVGLWYIRPDGHEVGIARSALQLRVTQMPDEVVEGYATPGVTVNLELYDGEGTLKGTAETIAGDDGGFNAQFHASPQQVDIEGGDRIEATANGQSVTLPVPLFLPLADAAHDFVSGVTSLPPGTWLSVGLSRQDTGEEWWRDAVVGENGHVVVDFSEEGVELRDQASLILYLPDGHQHRAYNQAMITSVTPNELFNDADRTIFIAGAGFQPTPEAVLLGEEWAPPSVVLPDVTYISDGLLQATVPAGTPAGVYYVEVPNPDGYIGFLSEALTIVNPEPTVTGIAPTEADNDASVNVVISGTDFVEGAVVSLVMDGAVIPGTSVTVISPTQISATFDLAGAAVGVYDVVVTNAGPREPTGILPGGFTVEEAVKRTFLPLVEKGA